MCGNLEALLNRHICSSYGCITTQQQSEGNTSQTQVVLAGKLRDAHVIASSLVATTNSTTTTTTTNMIVPESLTTCLLVAIVVFLLIITMVSYLNHPPNLPPGPTGFPILGVIPRLGKKPHRTIQKWWAKYGDVYSMYMGSRLVIVLNGVDVMKEALVRQGDIFTGRPWNFFKKLTKNTGIVFTDGDVWREHRRFTLSCLRDFGMGKVSLEAKIQQEASILITEIARQDGKPFDPRSLLPKAISNIICSIIYGSRFDYSDPVFQANIDALDVSVRGQSLLGMIQFIPSLEFLPKVLPQNKVLMNNVKMRDEFAAEQLQKHRESFVPEDPRDFIDAYIDRMMHLKAKGEHTSFEDKQLHRTIQDLFIAGTETVNTTLKWALLFMMAHPNVQARVQAEIDTVIGTGRFPTMKDKAKMPYTDATLMECQRVGNIALFSVPRCTLEETTLNGYTIPKGAWIFVNRWGVHAASRYWKNPMRFNPERFIDEKGEVFKPDAFVPFGVGPRSCLGERLAKMELFVFFTAILQAFKVHLPSDKEGPSLEPQPGINMSPAAYTICADHR